MAEPFDPLVQGLTLMISRIGPKVKVIGQGYQVKKRDFQDYLTSVPGYETLAYGMTI